MRGLSLSRTETKTVPAVGTQVAGAELALGEGDGEVAVEAHHLAGRAHLRAEQHVDAGEAGEGEDRFLDRDMADAGRLRGRSSASVSPAMTRARDLGDRHADRPWRRRARCARRAD